MMLTTSTDSYLIFQRNRTRFAIDADAVCEILSLPELSPSPYPRPAIVGLVHLRGKVVPVMDLDLRLGLPPQFPYRVTDRLILLEWEGVTIGLVVNEVIDVTSLNAAAITPTEEAGKFATGVAHLDGEMVVLLDLARLIPRLKPTPDAGRNGHGSYKEFVETAPIAVDLPKDITDPDPAAQEIFRQRRLELVPQIDQVDTVTGAMAMAIVGLNDERIGIPITTVREFSTVRGVTPVPGCPPHIRGLMNLRGELLALVDIRSVLQLPPSENEARQMAVVVQSEELRLGIVVDTVIDVITVPNNGVHSVGTTAPSRMNGFVQGTAYHGDVLFSILDLERILREGGLVVDEAATFGLS